MLSLLSNSVPCSPALTLQYKTGSFVVPEAYFIWGTFLKKNNKNQNPNVGIK